MDVAELGQVDTLKKLFETFNQKRDILHLLEQAINADGMQILSMRLAACSKMYCQCMLCIFCAPSTRTAKVHPRICQPAAQLLHFKTDVLWPLTDRGKNSGQHAKKPVLHFPLQLLFITLGIF